MNEILASINSGPLLAQALGVRYSKLTYHLYKIPDSENYTRFEVRKKSGGTRKIRAPHPIRRYYQRRLLALLADVYSPPSCAHGFITNRSIYSNALPHAGAHWVLNFDLKDFFEQIHFGRIFGLLRSPIYGLDETPARLIAQLACFEGRLPQGAPTSPLLANMIARPLDTQLSRLAYKNKVKYTRYADDLTISGRSLSKLWSFVSVINCSPTFYAHFEVESSFFSLADSLIATIENNGFEVNSKKNRLQIKNSRKSVTGLIVNRKVNVPRRFVRSTRAALHAWERYGYKKANDTYLLRFRSGNAATPDFRSFQKHLKGRIDYIGQIKGTDSVVYIRQHDKFYDLERFSFPDGYLAPKPIDPKRRLRETVWVVHVTYQDNDGDKSHSQGTAFFVKGMGFITCSHIFPEAGKYNSDFPLIVRIHPEFEDKADHPAKLMAKSNTYDVALLSLAATAVAAEPLFGLEMDPNPSFLGNPTLTVAGFPNHAAMDSLYIAEGKHLQMKKKDGLTYHSLSARISKGNSGGPVLDSEGKVVGVATRGLSESEEVLSAGDTLFSGFVANNIIVPIIEHELGAPPYPSR